MLKQARTGIAFALFFASLFAAAVPLLNPRFVDHVPVGVSLFLLIPILGGAAAGFFLGRPLWRLAQVGSNEDITRAHEMLWGTLTGFVTFPVALAVLPAYIGIFSNSETVRYGGALLLAIGLAWLGAATVWYVANRARLWIWPLLLALPLAVVLTGTEWGRGKAPGSRLLAAAFHRQLGQTHRRRKGRPRDGPSPRVEVGLFQRLCGADRVPPFEQFLCERDFDAELEQHLVVGLGWERGDCLRRTRRPSPISVDLTAFPRGRRCRGGHRCLRSAHFGRCL